MFTVGVISLGLFNRRSQVNSITFTGKDNIFNKNAKHLQFLKF